MIKPLDQKQIDISEKIYAIFQVSYAVEAALLKCEDFPPLNRSIEAIQLSQSIFYGYFINHSLAAVMELEEKPNHVHVRSLTVDPKYFRQGIGFKLLQYVKDHFDADMITVETGHDNSPAVQFYLNFGFKKNKVWMTEFGIEKISFILKRRATLTQ